MAGDLVFLVTLEPAFREQKVVSFIDWGVPWSSIDYLVIFMARASINIDQTVRGALDVFRGLLGASRGLAHNRLLCRVADALWSSRHDEYAAPLSVIDVSGYSSSTRKYGVF